MEALSTSTPNLSQFTAPRHAHVTEPSETFVSGPEPFHEANIDRWSNRQPGMTSTAAKEAASSPVQQDSRGTRSLEAYPPAAASWPGMLVPTSGHCTLSYSQEQSRQPSKGGGSAISPRRSHKKRAAPALVADQDVPSARPTQQSAPHPSTEGEVTSSSSNDGSSTTPAGRQADAVEHLLRAGCDGRKWLPLDYRAFQYSAALQRAAAKIYASRSSADNKQPAPSHSAAPPPTHDAPAAASSSKPHITSQPFIAAGLAPMSWPGPLPTPDGLLCGALGLSLPPAEVDETFWHWGEDRDRAAGAQAWLAPLSFKHASPLHLAAFYGHVGVVEVLLASGACDPHALNAQGCTALHMAAHQGHADAAARLCRGDACEVDAADGMGRTALHHAAALGHEAVVMELWAGHCSVHAADIDGWTALHHACQAGHTEVAAQLVIAGAPVQTADAHGRTPAHLAARRGAHEVVDKLLMAGYEVDALGGDCGTGLPLDSPQAVERAASGMGGCAVLHLAARHGHLLLLEKLLTAGADPRLRDCRGYTPLHCAAEGGHLALFERLLQATDDVTVVDNTGASVLHAAAAGGCWEMVDLLLQQGCDINATTREGCTVLHYAAFGRTKGVVEQLISRGCKLDVGDSQGNTPWHAAAESGNLEAMALFMEVGCQPDARNNAGWTALHFAARSGSVPIVELLAEAGADVGAATQMGDTPLQLAARAGHERTVVRLLKPPTPKGGGDLKPGDACVHAADRMGWSALHCAAQAGSLSVTNLLLQAGAKLNLQTLDGLTPLHLAAMGRWTPLVARLLEAGADATLVDCEGCAPLHRAVRLADVDLFNSLFRACPACARRQDNKGWTVLHYAVEGGNPAIVAALLAAKAAAAEPDASAEGKDSETAASAVEAGSSAESSFTPLHLAAQKGHASLIATLMQAGYHATDLAGDGRTPLHYAALGSGAGVALPAAGASQMVTLVGLPGAGVGPRSHAQAARLLLTAGAPPHALDSNGCSALHYAAGTGEADLCNQLLAQGVSVGVTDKSGWTPLLWAASGGHSAVVNRLLEAGAKVHVTDRIGRSVLHLAAEHGHSHAVSILVKGMADRQLDLHAQDGAGRTAVQVAAGAGHVDVVTLVLDSGQTQGNKGLTALHLAVQQGRDSLVSDLLKLPSIAPNARDADGLSALHWAASKDAGSEHNVAQLIAAGCGVDVTTNDGWTALHEACANGHTGVVQQLLEASASINIKTANGSTALHNAATNGHDEIVRLLLARDCAVNARALSGATALYGAASGGNLAVVRRLLEADAEVDAATTAGSTACAAAATSGHTPVVRALIMAGCDVDLQAQNGCTALHNAAGGGHATCVAELQAAGCDVDIQNSHGNTALHVAASKGHLEVVELLLAAGADVHIKNSKAWAAVHSAAAAGHFEPVLRLIQHGSVWRGRSDVDVIKLLMRKTSLKHSYVEGRLRLAEKERARRQAKVAGPGINLITAPSGPSSQELEQLEAQANANMAALLLEEASTKEASEKRREKKKEKKKKKGRKPGSEEATAEQSADEDEPSSQQEADSSQPEAEDTRTREAQPAIDAETLSLPESSSAPAKVPRAPPAAAEASSQQSKDAGLPSSGAAKVSQGKSPPCSRGQGTSSAWRIAGDWRQLNCCLSITQGG
ncbi:hypothetical protein WJX73_009765 [Symbiochloris irregularis]|uniref:Uncharacterized protein n=1 Tax=Symbiochloris irregularis TaxID=706552 RepID=A0AAW1NQM4_9CHLO